MTDETHVPEGVPRSGPVFQPLRGKRAFEEVADRVRQMLEEGELKVGYRLPAERELSKQLNVSRSILREALRTLENTGLLELKPGKLGGAFVSDGKPEAVSETMSDLLRLGGISLAHLTEGRAWIEEVVVRVACERADEADFLALEANVRKADSFCAGQNDGEARCQHRAPQRAFSCYEGPGPRHDQADPGRSHEKLCQTSGSGNPAQCHSLTNEAHLG
jgi:DNA-binding FadR family transcriptional regulator